MNRRLPPRLLFITGSDTGVGKTVLTALLTAHLRRAHAPVLAIKPFCSGGRGDAELLLALQRGELSLDEINPYYFAEPLAPLVAVRQHRRSISPIQILCHIRAIAAELTAASRSTLLIEGVGGLFVPLAERFSVLDLIRQLKCEVLIVAPNKLGTINHCLLTIDALRRRHFRRLKLVLMDTAAPDLSCASNPRILAELISPTPLVRIPFLRPVPATSQRIERHAPRLEPHLQAVLAVTGQTSRG